MPSQTVHGERLKRDEAFGAVDEINNKLFILCQLASGSSPPQCDDGKVVAKPKLSRHALYVTQHNRTGINGGFHPNR